MSESSIIPFTEDALNRFRITHSDRDLRPLLRRLHRLPHLTSISTTTDEPNTEHDAAHETEMVRLELLKWRASTERIMGSATNLQRQKDVYLKRAEETVARTERLRGALEEEKRLLEGKRRERDWLVRCDEVAGRITARGASRTELDDRIAELQQSLADHRATHELYLSTTQARIDTFSQITRLVEGCRALKLPIEPQATLAEQEEKMDDDEPLPTSASPGGGSKLDAAALPFSPTPVQESKARASTPPATTTKLPSSGHTLPSRPARPSTTAPATASSSTAPRVPSSTTRIPSSSLPSRPSALRSVTGPAVTASLEEGELGGEEEGEVAEGRERRGVKRGADERDVRSTRSRK